MALEPLPTEGALNLGATTITSQMDQSTSYQPPPISSVMRASTPLQETPQTVNVVPAQVIRDQAPRNLDDALANVSGITQGNTLGSTQDSVMTRGFGDNRNGSIMRDGMPVVQGRGMNATVDRVEVLKGPASLLYGIQDPGGVVNMVSKQPELDPYNAVTLRLEGQAKHGAKGVLVLDKEHGQDVQAVLASRGVDQRSHPAGTPARRPSSWMSARAFLQYAAASRSRPCRNSRSASAPSTCTELKRYTVPRGSSSTLL